MLFEYSSPVYFPVEILQFFFNDFPNILFYLFIFFLKLFLPEADHVEFLFLL